MKGIVTGATGFLGFALCQELLSEGDEVVAVIRPHSANRYKLEQYLGEHPEYQAKAIIIELNLEELDRLDSEFHVRAEAFYHLAWNGAAGAEREDFDIQYRNVEYTANAIRTAKACSCRRVVGAGSQAEYGVVHGIAREKETVPNPFMMYGAAKLAAYQMGQVLAKQLDIEFVWPRIYSVYGVGENPGTLVNYVLNSLGKGEVPELSPCDNMWNFLYVTDCARMLRLLGISDKVTDGIYHVASEDTRLLREFVEEIRDTVAPGMELGFGTREGNPERTFWLEPDTSRIRGIAGEYRVSFEEGISRKR